MNLSVSKGCFSYEKEQPVFEDISFEVDRGEVLAVLGPNGVGKTTLLKCLLGFLKWQSGSASFMGKSQQSFHGSSFWKEVAYVPQARKQTFPYTVEETVLLGRSPYLGIFGKPGERDRLIADKAMRMTGVDQLRNRNCSDLSGGELQLVLIARALCAEPSILIMDEPETGLDFRNQLIILNLIERLSGEEKLTVVFNTHYPEHALEVANRTLLLDNCGKAIFGKTEEVLTTENMEKVFSVKIRIVRQEENGRVHASILPVSLIREEKE
jgi:iron complex transport system ATP-binding protein